MSAETNTSTKAAKTATVVNKNSIPLTRERLQELYPEDYILGDTSSGATIWKGREAIVDDGLPIDRPLLAAVRHPDWVVPNEDGTRYVTEKNIEVNIARSTSPEETQEMAMRVVTNAQLGILPSFGIEPERWLHCQGEVAALGEKDQYELNQGLLETTGEKPYQTSKEIALATAADIHNSAIKFGEYDIVDSSVPMSGTAHDAGLQQTRSGPLGPYVPLTVSHIRPLVGIVNDRITEQVGNLVARKFGYETFNHMIEEIPDLHFWINAASHGNVESVHNKDQHTEKLYSSRDIQDSEADFFNTDFATMAELLMLSTPMFLGELVSVQDRRGRTHPVRDVGAIYRYALRTTQESPFIRTSAEGNRRIMHLILNGHVATIDRGSFVDLKQGTLLKSNDKLFPSLHERVRERMGASAFPEKPLARTEYTGRRASISKIDEQASNTLLRLYIVSANEAVAQGKHPSDYFGEKYQHMNTWNRHKRLVHLFNIYGTNHPETKRLFNENLLYLHDMKMKYPSLSEDIEFVEERIQNMYLPTVAQSLSEYATNSTGSISDVIRREAGRNKPKKVVELASNYILTMGEKIQATQGNMSRLLRQERR